MFEKKRSHSFRNSILLPQMRFPCLRYRIKVGYGIGSNLGLTYVWQSIVWQTKYRHEIAFNIGYATFGPSILKMAIRNVFSYIIGLGEGNYIVIESTKFGNETSVKFR